MALKCVHQSCGKIYTDPEDECNYHPGPPIFHEGQKGQFNTPFYTFDFPSLTHSPNSLSNQLLTKHHRLEMLQAPRPNLRRIPFHHTLHNRPPLHHRPAARNRKEASRSSRKHACNRPVPLPLLQQLLAPQSQLPKLLLPPLPPPPESEDDEPSLEIPKGKICKRKACGFQYDGGERKGEQCVFHPGAPIFHEGSKGYTCCKRRVLEFDEFMKIGGCKTKDRHMFVGSGKTKGGNTAGEEVLETVRHDFYQTATTVIASFFLKKINKETVKVEFVSKNEISLDLITTDTPPKRYKTTVPLFGPIDTAASSFKIMGTKLELNIVKADGSSWPVLRSDEQRTGEIIQVGKAGSAR